MFTYLLLCKVAVMQANFDSNVTEKVKLTQKIFVEKVDCVNVHRHKIHETPSLSLQSQVHNSLSLSVSLTHYLCIMYVTLIFVCCSHSSTMYL